MPNHDIPLNSIQIASYCAKTMSLSTSIPNLFNDNPTNDHHHHHHHDYQSNNRHCGGCDFE